MRAKWPRAASAATSTSAVPSKRAPSESNANSTWPGGALPVARPDAATVTPVSVARKGGSIDASASASVPLPIFASATLIVHGGDVAVAARGAGVAGVVSRASSSAPSFSRTRSTFGVSITTRSSAIVCASRSAAPIVVSMLAAAASGVPSIRVSANRSMRAVPRTFSVVGTPFSVTKATLSRVVSAPSVSFAASGRGAYSTYLASGSASRSTSSAASFTSSNGDDALPPSENALPFTTAASRGSTRICAA